MWVRVLLLDCMARSSSGQDTWLSTRRWWVRFPHGLLWLKPKWPRLRVVIPAEVGSSPTSHPQFVVVSNADR